MKKITLFLVSLKRSWVSTIVLCIVMIFSIYILMISYAQYEYVYNTYRLIDNSVLEDDDLLCSLAYSSDIRSFKEDKEFIESLIEYESVQHVFVRYRYYAPQYGTIEIYDEEMFQFFPKLKKGNFSTNEANQDGSLNVLVGEGFGYGDKKINEKFKMSMDRSNEEIFEFKVSGIFPLLSVFPNFGTSLNEQYMTDDLYDNLLGLVTTKSEPILKLMDKYPEYSGVSERFYLKFDKTASEEERDIIKTILINNGGYMEIGDIKNNTINFINNFYLPRFLTPLFLTLISFICYISLSILSIYKSVEDNAIYFLLGYSKKKQTISVMLQVGILILISGGLNLFYANNYGLFVKDVFYMDYYLFNENVQMLIIGMMVIEFLFAGIVSAIILNKKTSIEIIRERTDG